MFTMLLRGWRGRFSPKLSALALIAASPRVADAAQWFSSAMAAKNPEYRVFMLAVIVGVLNALVAVALRK